MVQRPLLLTSVIAALALAAPGAASAANFCVPSAGVVGAACPAGSTDQATLDAALATADNANDLDRIYLAPGVTYTAPTTAGWSYNAASAPVRILGAGSTGAQKTTLTGPAGLVQLLSLRAGAGSALTGISVVLPDNGTTGAKLTVGNTAVGDTAITASATQANAFLALSLEAGSSFADATIDTVTSPKGDGLRVVGPGVTVARATVTASNPLSVSSSAVSTAFDRVHAVAGLNTGPQSGVGLEVDGAAATVTNSLIEETSDNNSCAVFSLDQNTDGRVDLDRVTLIGSGTDTTALCADSIFPAPRASTINVSNTIINGFTYDRSAFASSTGTPTINVAYSDFNPSTDRTPGANPVVLNPPVNTLGATNLNVNPSFVNAASNFRLTSFSPVQDAGDPTAALSIDLDGNPRPCNGRQDMGAYERQVGVCAATSAPPVAAGGGTPVAPDPTPTPDAGPGPGPVELSPPARPDTAAPVISALSLSHTTFRVGTSVTASTGAAHAAAKAKAKVPPTGTAVRFTLDEQAAVTILWQQRVPGRTSAGRCVAPTRKLRAAKACTRYATRARLRRTADAGRSSVAFSGRAGQVALSPGRYHMAITATDARGNVSEAATRAFRVVG